MTDMQPDAGEHNREWRLFYALDDDGDGIVPKADIFRALENAGLGRADARLDDLFADLDAHGGDALDFAAFLAIVGPAGLLVERALQGGLAVPDFADFAARVGQMFAEVEKDEGGKQADYIPPLAEVDADQFGLSVVTIDGQVLRLGKAETDFSIQSTCKPFNYCYALNEREEDPNRDPSEVHRHIGMEPSGRPFNARVLMQDGTNRPHNPMINAGAIMSAALIQSHRPGHRRLQYVRQMWSQMTGGSRPRFDAWMQKEEHRTGDNNRALGYMMKSAGILPNGSDATDHQLLDALELYFSTCSLELNATEMATASATLANGGVCPTTQKRVLTQKTVRNCLSLMQMCGMYDGSGEFCFRIGLPAKSGVGGGVILVVPGLMGICIWSPRLDPNGNSVRGVRIAEMLVEQYRLHLYDGVTSGRDRIDPRLPLARWRATQTAEALWAAGKGDVRTLSRLHGEHMDLRQGDYDLRSPMHLAAAEGHVKALAFLLEHDVDPNQADRWGGLPLDDAVGAGHTEAVKLLEKYGARKGNSHHLVDPEVKGHDAAADFGDDIAVVELLWAAAEDNVDGLRRLVAQGVPMHAQDYDRRTALHLAAAEGNLDAVRYLRTHAHPLHVRDRWNATPLDEAVREGRDAVAEFLRSWAADLAAAGEPADLAN